ncbi:efflux RND transporter periplasmic adaptor subunit [Roseivirga sp.]|uniref:efflux RND transporter periplasmic adaptor subunit n=1 Tax=Roseivirga sp. TaxID=1964215 RepID=UPI003B8DAB1B
MKPQSIITILVLTLVAFSCGPKDTIESKKARIQEAKAEMKALETEVSEIEKALVAEDPNYNKPVEAATLITTVNAAKENFDHKIEIRGNVESRTNVTISSEMMGLLTSLPIKEGQYVEKGQILATVDAENLKKSVDELENQLEFATTVFEKRDRLWKKNIGTEIDYLQAKNNKESLEKQLATLQTQLDKAEIKAPFNGTIETVSVRQGEIAQPGMPIAYLVGNANMYITAEVSESYIGKFNRGDKVMVSIPSLGKEEASKIISVGKVINPASRTFTIEVQLPRLGSSVKTNLVTLLKLTDYSSDDAVVIPSRLIQEDFEGNFVYTVKDKRAAKVHVKLGYSYDNHTEVLSGLNGGEVVVDKGNRTVANGTMVTAQN